MIDMSSMLETGLTFNEAWSVLPEHTKRDLLTRAGIIAMLPCRRPGEYLFGPDKHGNTIIKRVVKDD